MVLDFGVYFSQGPREKKKMYECLYVYWPFQFGNYSRVGSFWETLARFDCKLWKTSRSLDAVQNYPVLLNPLQTSWILNWYSSFLFLFGNLGSRFSFVVRLWLTPIKLLRGFSDRFPAFPVWVSSWVCKTKCLWKSQNFGNFLNPG